MGPLILCMLLSILTYSLSDAQEYDARCDINEDGIVDCVDLLRLQRSWHGVAWQTEITIEIPNLPPGAKPLTLVRIPAGSFQMGSYDDSSWCYPSEQPVHTVNIGYDFYLGKYEVTQAQWLAVMGSNPSYFTWCGNDCPVEQISWNDCQYFVTALNALVPGGGFRMPSEAEWEYACRGGTTTRFSFGNSTCNPDDCNPCDLSYYAWWCGNEDPHGTKVVGQKPASPFGLYDMHGNVSEWCEDDSHNDYTGAPTNGSPWVDSPRGSYRVVRGGGWDASAVTTRSSNRAWLAPTSAYSSSGFRVARDPVDRATPQPTPTPPLEEVTIDLPRMPANASPLVLVRIPAGSFQMGSYDDSSWSWCYPCEQPVHTVNIGYDFYLGKYEITQAQWFVVMRSDPASGYGDGNNYPVYSVSWDDCQAFVTSLNALVPGGGFRMPSEAEWEYACREATTTRFSFGHSTCNPDDRDPCDLSYYAWWIGNNGASGTPEYGTKIVGQKLANPFGLYDMHGNVWEWCQDWWHEGYTGAPADGSAWEAGGGTYRVFRGGNWLSYATLCRSSVRGMSLPANADFNYGFRVARDPVVQPTPTPTPEEVTVDLPGMPADATPLVLVRIPAGSFQMGFYDDASWSWCYPCEQPVHTVNIGYDFHLGKHEITQAQWLAVMGSEPASGYGDGNDYPVYYVSWNDCQAFVTALNALVPGGGFRIPSEAEWEYACRAGTTTRFPFGDSTCAPSSCTSCDLSNHAWWCGNNDPYGTKIVGQKLPNPLGLYDMHGNVYEWCQDWWHEGYTGAPADGSAWEAGGGTYRVLRGGYWHDSAGACRSSDRYWSYPTDTTPVIGFRVARTL